jgi:hypothetical protein
VGEKVIALLDGDTLAYRAAAAAIDEVDFGDGVVARTPNTRAATRNAVSLAKKWAAAAGCEELRVCLTHTTNFRVLIYPDYKAGRSVKPENYHAAVDALIQAFPIVEVPGLEADDVQGVMATSPKYAGKAVIVSNDKDLKTIPGRLYDPVKEVWHTITEYEANRNWMLQTLVGDPIDGYKGCPGIGRAKAERALEGCDTLDELVDEARELFLKLPGGETEFRLQARLARILRRSDYDPATKRVILWPGNEAIAIN